MATWSTGLATGAGSLDTEKQQSSQRKGFQLPNPIHAVSVFKGSFSSVHPRAEGTAWDVSALSIRKQQSPGHRFSGTHRYRNNVILSEGYNQILEQLPRAHAKFKARALERLNDFPGVTLRYSFQSK